MSEKFGLDWMNYDFQRMQDFILIQNIINKPKKDGSSNGTHPVNSRQVNRDGNQGS